VSAVKLSICIPTYNREAFLAKALTHCAEDYRFDFPYEIVISDNASTDNTSKVVEDFIARGLPIRYFRRATNGGSSRNLACAFRQARGDYAIYVADDDILVPDAVVSALAYLDTNPDVTACHAPWLLYDEVEDRDLTQFYKVEADTKFQRGQFAEVFRFLFEGHVFPEIAIYRTSALRASWVPREFCFWAFSYLAHFLDQGAVAFLQRPFYRSVAVSRLDQGRQQAGHDDVMTAWDRYRGGLEYFLHTGAERGNVILAPEMRRIYDEMCKVFTLERMAVALRFWAARKDFIKVYELYTRLALGGLGDRPEILAVRKTLPLMVGMQTLAWQVNSTAGIERIVFDGFHEEDVAYLTTLLQDLGLDPQIDVAGDAGTHSPESTAVVVPSLDDRQAFLSRGYLPNLVFAESDLAENVIV
jgi:glycosyltransferase involved in cell wall biosynthesis